MRAAARRVQAIIAGLLAALAACSSPRRAPAAAPAPHDARPAPPRDTGPAPDAARGPRITFTIEHAHAPGTGLAQRCALAGDPLASACIAGGTGIALDRSGTLYVVDGERVRRYRRSGGDACRYDPAGAPIALPAERPRAQDLHGAVYFRSGGPDWHLVAAGPAIYAYDFLIGTYRIDGGRAVPACTDVFGYDHLAWDGHALLASRNGLEQLATGPHCRAKTIDRAARGATYIAGGHRYLATRAFELERDGAPVAKGADLCSIAAVAPCGDGACVVDSNCKQLVQLDAQGAVRRTLDADALFDTRPWSLDDAIATPAGALLVLARHRDQTGSDEVCEAAIYEVPASAFAPPKG